MTKNLKWRLGKLPTVEELLKLIENKLITQDEAKEMLYSSEEVDVKSLEQEIKFLRELVQKLSNNQPTRIVEVIREVEKPWRRYGWYEPYMYYTTTGGSVQVSGGASTMTLGGNVTVSSEGSNKTFALGNTTNLSNDFTSIKTF